MIPRRIAGANHWLGAPAGWKPETQGDCGHLAIRTHGDPRHGSGWCESAWEPTPVELIALNAGGSIILRVVSWQPPVALYVETPERGSPIGKQTATPDVRDAKVCPKCEMEIGPLIMFCQNNGCPCKAALRGDL